MKKRKVKVFSLILSLSLLSGMGQGARVRVRAEEKREGYGYKNGKIYSVEIKDDKAEIKDMAESSNVGEEERFIIKVERGEEEKYFCVDKTGKKMSEEYDFMNEFSEGMAVVGKKVERKTEPSYDEGIDYEYGYIDKTGKLVIPMKYSEAEDFSNGIAIVSEGRLDEQRAGLINKKGESS